MTMAGKHWLCLSLVLGAGTAMAGPAELPRMQLLIVLTAPAATEPLGTVRLAAVMPAESRPIVADWIKDSRATIVPLRGAVEPPEEERS